MDKKDAHEELSNDKLPLRTIFVVFMGLFPLALTGYLSLISRHNEAQMAVILNFMWVIGIVISCWVLYLQVSFVRQPIRELNRMPAGFKNDALDGLLMGGILAVFGMILNKISPKYVGFDQFIHGLSNSPGQMLFFLCVSLLLWATYEELTRAFILSQLWSLSSSKKIAHVILAACALLFALTYAYQGWGAMVTVGAAGLLFGGYYLSRGRFLPMLIAHYMLNLVLFGAQILF